MLLAMIPIVIAEEDDTPVPPLGARLPLTRRLREQVGYTHTGRRLTLNCLPKRGNFTVMRRTTMHLQSTT